MSEASLFPDQVGEACLSWRIETISSEHRHVQEAPGVCVLPAASHRPVYNDRIEGLEKLPLGI